MEHNINYNKNLVANLEDVKIYVSSYEVSQDRKFSFMNYSDGGFYMTDNGIYPSYVKIKGTILRSECSFPCVKFSGFANKNTRFFFNLDGMYFGTVYLKNYSITTKTGDEMIECEVVLCSTSITET